MSGKPTKAVLEMSKLRIVGNITPNTWYELIRFPATPKFKTGKPHPLAVLLLSEICYWYRTSEDLRDSKTTKSIPPQKRFDADKWQTSYNQLAEKFGFSKEQVKQALYRLDELGLITMEFRSIRVPRGILNNVLYVEPIVKNIEKITFYNFDSVKNQGHKPPPPPDNPTPPPKNRESTPRRTGRVPPEERVEHPPKNGETNTETPTGIPSFTPTDINLSVINENDLFNDPLERELLERRKSGDAVMKKDDARSAFENVLKQVKQGKPVRVQIPQISSD